MAALVGLPAVAWGSGPRFVSGNGWGVPPGTPVGWGTNQLLYYTDPGSLSAAVNHAQADAMVAAAAAVWNVPTSSLSLSQGGELAEHVTTANTSVSATSLMFPADVQIANEGNIPVAVIYDTDGSLIDLLLGAGASEPDGCLQNSVVGDVDDIHPGDGHIHHATLILNGLCVGSAAADLTQMQYQLARAFGRVLGLSWSQTNDNVFTGETTITANQLAYWPLMHPMDVICGKYTYQCMSNPFTLRPDDLNGLATLYLVPQGSVPAGKQATSDDALWIFGELYFPTGQGMEWVNFTTSRQNNGVNEDWQTVSTTTGSLYLQSGSNPVTLDPAAGTTGTTNQGYEGYFGLRRIPLNSLSNVAMNPEPINPLYMGELAIGPYLRPPATPSGTPPSFWAWSALPGGDQLAYAGSLISAGASSSCSPGADGTASSPAALDPSGWQTGLVCSWGHSSWWSVTAAAGHSWTFEVTATDETGAATDQKLQPLIGVWNAADATGTKPTVASEAVPFNSLALGVTQLRMSAAGGAKNLRIAVTDQFGGGRPDFTYTARLLYAASVSPAQIPSGGGRISITGTGFRQGNQVRVNGVLATVVSCTSTQIVAVAPTVGAAQTFAGVPVSVGVTDSQTNGSTAISGAVQYTTAPDLLQEVSAPAALATGVTAPIAFAVRVVSADGVTPVRGAEVRFAVTAGTASLGVCLSSSNCTGTSDANGLVQTSVTGGAVGAVTLTATQVSGGATVQVNLNDTAPAKAVTLSRVTTYVAAGVRAQWTLALNATIGGVGTLNVPVAWTLSPGLVMSTGDASTGSGGLAQLVLSTSGLAAGSVGTVTGCAWVTVCATWTIHAVDPSQWQVTVGGGSGQSVQLSQSLGAVALEVTDLAGHALEDAPVQIYQRVEGWEGVCGGTGACAAAPVLATLQTQMNSDDNGSVSLAPLQLPGIPQVVQIAAVSGTQGFVTFTLVKTP